MDFKEKFNELYNRKRFYIFRDSDYEGCRNLCKKYSAEFYMRKDYKECVEVNISLLKIPDLMNYEKVSALRRIAECYFKLENITLFERYSEMAFCEVESYKTKGDISVDIMKKHKNEKFIKKWFKNAMQSYLFEECKFAAKDTLIVYCKFLTERDKFKEIFELKKYIKDIKHDIEFLTYLICSRYIINGEVNLDEFDIKFENNYSETTIKELIVTLNTRGLCTDIVKDRRLIDKVCVTKSKKQKIEDEIEQEFGSDIDIC